MEPKSHRTQEVNPVTRFEVYQGLSARISSILDGRVENSHPLNITPEEKMENRSFPIQGKSTSYTIIRDLKMDSLEFLIRKQLKIVDGTFLEEIKFKVGRPGMSLREPDFEYFRMSQGRKSRPPKPNSIGAIFAIEKFLNEMEKDLELVPRSLQS